MARLRLSTQAIDDVERIAEYVSTASGYASIGERLGDQIFDRCEQLVSLPTTMGRPRPELRADLRSVAFKGYVIFFRYVGETLEVVNVLEGHRDIDSFYSDE